jgi:predicted nucleotidyltransferase
MLEWIPEPERSYLLDVAETLPHQVPAIQKMILFGSMARGTARPMSDPDPSDLDLFVLVSSRTPEIDTAIYAEFGQLNRLHDIERDEHILVDQDFTNWSQEFIRTLVTEGITLYDAARQSAIA